MPANAPPSPNGFFLLHETPVAAALIDSSAFIRHEHSTASSNNTSTTTKFSSSNHIRYHEIRRAKSSFSILSLSSISRRATKSDELQSTNARRQAPVAAAPHCWRKPYQCRSQDVSVPAPLTGTNVHRLVLGRNTNRHQRARPRPVLGSKFSAGWYYWPALNIFLFFFSFCFYTYCYAYLYHIRTVLQTNTRTILVPYCTIILGPYY